MASESGKTKAEILARLGQIFAISQWPSCSDISVLKFISVQGRI